MAKKPSAQYKRFSTAMSKIVRVSKEELLRREQADREKRNEAQSKKT
jgi:hypothetical protein